MSLLGSLFGGGSSSSSATTAPRDNRVTTAGDVRAPISSGERNQQVAGGGSAASGSGISVVFGNKKSGGLAPWVWPAVAAALGLALIAVFVARKGRK